jgi:hypothetical protein
MKTTKNIRIATGIKRIELGNESMAMLQISDILRQHRECLITSLLSDLTTYIQYKFSTPPTKEQIDTVTGKLVQLKNGGISLARYSSVIAEVLSNENTYIKSEPFYHEINEVITDELNPTQLVLAPSAGA